MALQLLRRVGDGALDGVHHDRAGGRHLARMDVKSGDDWTTARFWCYDAAPMGQQFQLFDMGAPVAEGTSS